MKGSRFFALGALTLALNQAVYAAHDADMLSDVVVSASRIEQSTKEAPANVSVVNAQKLESGNSFVIGDALTAKTPSLYLRGGAVDGGRPGTTMQPSFRGMGINRNRFRCTMSSVSKLFPASVPRFTAARRWAGLSA
jgi:iron complex outermembrane receptor protein